MARTDRAAEPKPVGEMRPICRALRAAREAAGITQDELARRLNKTQAHVSRWEKDREPDLDMISTMERVLDLPKGYLFRSAGYADDLPLQIEGAIAFDDRLMSGYRAVAAKLYRSLIEQSAEDRARMAPSEALPGGRPGSEDERRDPS